MEKPTLVERILTAIFLPFVIAIGYCDWKWQQVKAILPPFPKWGGK